MRKKFLLGLTTFVVAFVILSVSVMESSSISYVFATPVPANSTGIKTPTIEYNIPYTGKVSPDSPLWFLKALRDKVWYMSTSDHLKKAEMALLFSDKRLIASKTLFESKKPDIAFSTLTKGEKYLEIATIEEGIARKEGVDTTEFVNKLAIASLKHRQIIEELLPITPEDAKPEIIKIEDYAKNTYKYCRDILNSKGMTSPKNPFDGD